MIKGLKPYPKYKGSDLPWLQNYPAHWDIQRGKSVLHCVDVRSTTGKEELLTVSSSRGVIARSTTSVTMFKAKSYVGYKLCWPGDLVINSLWAWGGGLGVAQSHGIISTAYSVYRKRPTAPILPKYLHEYLRSQPYNWEFHVRSKGIWISRLQLTDTAFLDAPVLIPPLPEQTAIVKFLNYSTSKIDQAIRAKQKLIKLLEEQKQVIIHRAVTRGLDPNVKLKDSGVEWLGQIPEHWEVRPIKQLVTKMDYGTSENGRSEGSVRMLTMGHIQYGKVIIPDRGCLNFIPEGLLLERYDLLFNRTNSPELVGKVGIFEGDASDKVTFASYLVRIRLNSQYNPYWFNFLVNSSGFWRYAKSQALVSLHQANLNSKRYGQMGVPVPRTLAEQNEIVSQILLRTNSIEDGIDRAHKEITLLREYRTRLIADVVTGKLDVRDAARDLPDIAEESLPTEELTDEFDDEFSEDDES